MHRNKKNSFGLLIYLFSLFVCFNMADVQEKNRNRKEGVPQTAGCVQSEPRVSGKWLWALHIHTCFKTVTFNKGHFEMFLFGSLEIFFETDWVINRLPSHAYMEISWRECEKNLMLSLFARNPIFNIYNVLQNLRHIKIYIKIILNHHKY